MPTFKCRDVGMRCKFEVKSKDSDELLKMFELHSEKSHSLKKVPPPLMDKVKQVIKNKT